MKPGTVSVVRLDTVDTVVDTAGRRAATSRAAAAHLGTPSLGSGLRRSEAAA